MDYHWVNNFYLSVIINIEVEVKVKVRVEVFIFAKFLLLFIFLCYKFFHHHFFATKPKAVLLFFSRIHYFRPVKLKIIDQKEF